MRPRSNSASASWPDSYRNCRDMAQTSDFSQATCCKGGSFGLSISRGTATSRCGSMPFSGFRR
jgi:hypothetical protein